MKKFALGYLVGILVLGLISIFNPPEEKEKTDQFQAIKDCWDRGDIIHATDHTQSVSCVKCENGNCEYELLFKNN